MTQEQYEQKIKKLEDELTEQKLLVIKIKQEHNVFLYRFRSKVAVALADLDRTMSEIISI